MQWLIAIVVMVVLFKWAVGVISVIWPWLIGLVAIVIVGIIWITKNQEKEEEELRVRRAEFEKERQEAIIKHQKELRAKFLAKYLGDIETVDKILNREIWEGQTAEQLRDSQGNPVEVDEKILKTKSKEIWKYDQTGKGRFALRVTLENNEVIGWEKKV